MKRINQLRIWPATEVLVVGLACLVVLVLTAIGHAESPALLPTASLVLAQTGAGFAGQVTDMATGQAIPGVSVHAAGAQVSTGADGRYLLPLPPGTYDVRAEAAGYIGMTAVRQTLTGPGSAHLDFAMIPVDPSPAAAARIDAVLAIQAAREAQPEPPGSSAKTASTTAVTQVPRTVRVLMPDNHIQVMDMDEYLKGVVPAEIGAYRPAEILRAQAIAARSYAATHCPDCPYDVDTTGKTQVWTDRHYDTTDAAVVATHGIAPRYNGALIQSLYFARTAGYTANNEEVWRGAPLPYLRSIASPDPFNHRYGHGVGLSQEGGTVLASWGATYPEILRYYYTGGVVPPLAAPVLTDGLVQPATGTATTPFAFRVTYRDDDGDPPTIGSVRIDGLAYTMTLAAGDFRTGATFVYTTTLPGGQHPFDFRFSDGYTDPVILPGGLITVTAETAVGTNDNYQMTNIKPPGIQAGTWHLASRQDWMAGDLAGARLEGTADQAVLVLDPKAGFGLYTSAVHAAAFEFMAVGAKWNADIAAEHALAIEVRTSDDGARWSKWYLLPDVDGGPSPEKARNTSDLLFVRGRLLQIRLSIQGESEPVRIRDLTLTYLDSRAGPTADELAAAATLNSTQAGQPRIFSRAEWGANESYRFQNGQEVWPPDYMSPQGLVIHHTASPELTDPAAWIRAVYYYHAVTLGWGDIGYNFVVDKEGRLYQGRYPGTPPGSQIVKGGHALQFNCCTVGIVVLGDYQSVSWPTAASIQGLVDISAWLVTRFGLDPLGRSFIVERTVYNISGHRDVLPGHTACPGDRLYPYLPELRQRTWDAIHSDQPTPTPPAASPTPTLIPIPPPTPLATPTPALPGEWGNRVVNGDFEINNGAWWRNRAYYTTYDKHSGSSSLFIGLLGTEPDTASYASAQQELFIPSDAESIQLSFWYQPFSADMSGDRQLVRFYDGDTWIALSGDGGELTSNSGQWTQRIYDLTQTLAPYRGRNIHIYFGVINNGTGGKTYMRLDDVALNVRRQGGPIPTSTPTQTPGPTFTPSATPTQTSLLTPVPITCTEWALNGSFEKSQDGLAPEAWVIQRTNTPAHYVTGSGQAHSGTHAVLLGLTNPLSDTFGFSSIWQDFIWPPGVLTATLSFWYQPASQDPDDRQIAELRITDDGTRERLLGTGEPENAPGAWKEARFVLNNRYPNRPAQLYFSVLNRSSGGVTSMLIDDISLRLCGQGLGGPQRQYFPLVSVQPSAVSRQP